MKPGRYLQARGPAYVLNALSSLCSALFHAAQEGSLIAVDSRGCCELREVIRLTGHDDSLLHAVELRLCQHSVEIDVHLLALQVADDQSGVRKIGILQHTI